LGGSNEVSDIGSAKIGFSSVNEHIQKMVLGTAQLRSRYGIANRGEAPTANNAFRILKTAWNAGIRYVDTAPGYRSEAIIGEFVRAQGIQDDIKILTKIPSLGSVKEWKNFVHDSLEASFKSLGSERIEVLFFHDPKDATLLLGHMGFFKELLASFPVKALGISVYEPEEVQRMNGCGLDLAIQFPFNVLDRRFEKNVIPKGNRFGRSVFLQGLLAGESLREDAPGPLRDLHAAISADCKSHGVSALQLSLAYAANSDAIDFFLIGVDTDRQLRDLLSLDLNLPETLGQSVSRWCSFASDKCLDPRKWN